MRARRWEQVVRYFPARVVVIGYGYFCWLRLLARVRHWLQVMLGRTGRRWVYVDSDRVGEGWEVAWTAGKRR